MTNLQKISILCAAVLTMGLSACGETAENSDSKNTAVTTTTTAAETTTTTTAAPADDSVAETTTASSESADFEIADSEEKSEHSGIIKTKNEFCNGELYAKYSYNESGLLIRKDVYIKYADAFPLQPEESYAENEKYYTYDYDENGNCILNCEYNKDGIVSKSETKYEYDEDNKITKETIIQSNGYTYISTYFYNVQDNDYTGQIIDVNSTLEISNDNTDWIKRTEVVNNDSNYSYVFFNAYDSHNNPIIYNCWAAITSPYFVKNIYDDNGNIIEIRALEQIPDERGLYTTPHDKLHDTPDATFEYDSENRLIKKYISDDPWYYHDIYHNEVWDGEITTTTYYEYNDNNELTKETCRLLDSDKDDWKYELSYDYEYYD